MFRRRSRRQGRTTEPLRHNAALESLGCGVCGAGPFVECDIITHQDYANARFPCTVCGAAAGEVCQFDCEAADALITVLFTIQSGQPEQRVAL